MFRIQVLYQIGDLQIFSLQYVDCLFIFVTMSFGEHIFKYSNFQKFTEVQCVIFFSLMTSVFSYCSENLCLLECCKDNLLCFSVEAL